MAHESPRFQRRRENFTCLHCGRAVRGNGYTNHCPQCLWSKHVDVMPGDRAEQCAGPMEPIGIEVRADRYRITHRCERCGYQRTTRAAPLDSMDAIIKVSARTPPHV